MKKLLLFLALLFPLVSCEKQESYDKVLMYKIYFNRYVYQDNVFSFFYDMDEKTIQSYIDNKKDLFLYVHALGCSSYCGTFLYSLENFSKENGILIPYIQVGLFNNLAIADKTDVSSKLVIIRDGKIDVSINVSSNENEMTIKNFFSKYIDITSCYLANDLLYDEKQVTNVTTTHFLYKEKKYSSSTYQNYQTVDDYLLKEKRVLLVNPFETEKEEILSLIEENSISSIYFENNISRINSRFSFDLKDKENLIISKDGDKYSYLTISSKSLIS